MIGPSSGTNEVQNNDVDENPVRVKRKIFEELDIDSFCDEVCQSAKKCNSINHDTLDMSEVIQFSSSEGLVQDLENGESVTRLEVLVVDGTWDVSSLASSDLIDFLPTLNCDSEISIGQNIEGIDNSYGTILSYWEPEISENEDILNNSVPTPVELPPSSPRPSSVITQVPGPPFNQPDDQENGNLSWLLDFKLDSLIEAPEEKITLPSSRVNNTAHKSRNQATSTYLNDTRKSFNNENNESVIQSQTASGYSSAMDNRNYSSNRYGSSPKKPPFTYTELIEHALQEKGELTVSAIYQWISEHFPFYKSNDDRWKNSVRHNLSINPHFRKGSKAPHGAGHLWAIANREEMRPRQLTALQNFMANPTQKKNNVETIIYPRKNTTENLTRQSVVLDEVAAATASISQPPEENVVVPSVTLEDCAEQILNGIKREVEVQYLVPMNVQNNSSQKINQVQTDEQACCTEKETEERDCWNVLADFLNPVSKEVVAEECGLIGEGYLVTDLNPTTLGLSMAESEIITSDNLFGEELSFQFYELTSSSSQIQSA